MADTVTSHFHFMLTCNGVSAGCMELSHVELQANDGEHKDSHEQQQADLKQGDHGLHYGLEHHLQAWMTVGNTQKKFGTKTPRGSSNR